MRSMVGWILLIIGLPISMVLIYGAVRAAQPMELPQARGMTYAHFLEDRIEVISNQESRCQAMYSIAYGFGVPFYSTFYTYVGLYPDSYLARHAMPDPFIPEKITVSQVPKTWWTLVEQISWKLLATRSLTQKGNECILPPVN